MEGGKLKKGNVFFSNLDFNSSQWVKTGNFVKKYGCISDCENIIPQQILNSTNIKSLRFKNTVQNANFLNYTFFWIFSPMCSTTYGQSTLLDKLAAQEKIKVRVKTENLLSPRACAAFSYMLHALHSVLKCEFEPQLQFWLLWSTYYPALMWFFWQTPYR